MNTTITMQGKPLIIETTARAQQALARRASPLLVEMQLYFSCMIVKNVLFSELEADDRNHLKVSDELSVRFRPVMRETCSFDKILATPKTDLDIAHSEKFMPKWLKIDYNNESWTGEFGYK